MFVTPGGRAKPSGALGAFETAWVRRALRWTSKQKAQGRANLDVLKKNYFINGAMMVSQENGTTAGTTTNYYPVDQFFCAFSNAGATSVAQVASTTPEGSPNRLRVTATTADAAVAAGDFSYVAQRIEGLHVSDLKLGLSSAKTIIIQFGVKAPAGTYCVTALNSATNRSYVAEYLITSSEANTDVVKSVTFSLDISGTWLVTSGIGLEIRWGLMCGTTYQQVAGSWSTVNAAGSSNQFNFMGTISNVFELFDVSLTEGTVAPAFQVPNYASELALCRRYYEKTALNNDRHPGVWYNASVTFGIWKFSTVKRAAPTMTFPGTTSNYKALVPNTGEVASNSVPSADTVTTDCTHFRHNFAGLGVIGHGTLLYGVTDATMVANARI